MSEGEQDLRYAECELSRIASMAAKLMRAAKAFADKSDHVVVPRERYQLLELLFSAACDLEAGTTMTRDYKDAIEAGHTTYVGKKYLLNRSKYEQFCVVKSQVKAARKSSVPSLALPPANETPNDDESKG